MSLQNCGCCLNDQELGTGWGANMVTEVHKLKCFGSVLIFLKQYGMC